MKSSHMIAMGIIFAVALFVSVGAVLWGTGALSTVGVPGIAPVDTSVKCDTQTTPNLTVKAVDEYAGTALTEATNIYRIKGQTTWTTFTAGTGFDIGYYEDIEVVMGITSSDFLDNAYGQYFEYTVPCTESPNFEMDMSADEIEGSVTGTFYNADGTAGAETFTADQEQVVSVKLRTGANEVFGNPYITGSNVPTKDGTRSEYPNVLCMDLNSSAWDQPVKVYLADGTKMNSVSTPNRHGSSTGNNTYCYEMPILTDVDTQIFLRLDSDDSNAPVIDSTLTAYAANFYINADDKSNVYYGVETEEDAAVGTDAGATVTLDFTA